MKSLIEFRTGFVHADAADGTDYTLCGIIIEATPDELAALPFNPVYAEVEIRPARGGGGNQRREGAGA